MQSRVRRPRATVVTVASIAALASAVVLGLTACSNTVVVSTVGKVGFDRALAIPPLAASTSDAEGRTVFELTPQRGNTEFLPGRVTPTSGYGQSYLGPTIVAKRGDDVVVNVHNELPESTTVHWHGMHLPAREDGGPHQPIPAGGDRSPAWTIDQPAATLWYHPHPHEKTEKQVMAGLAGMVILQDDAEAALPLPRTYGVDDLPVIVQDVRFDSKAKLTGSVRGFVGALGDQLVVNGTVGPFQDVTTDVVRLRLLNASPARIYNFGFSDGREVVQIATDGGLLEVPVPTKRAQLSPGERAEVLVRMAPGEQVVLRSYPVEMGLSSAIKVDSGSADSFDVLQLRASATLASVGSVPAELVPMSRLKRSDVVAERYFKMDGMQIDDKGMAMDRIDETVTVDTTELWTIHNDMNQPHSFHVHDVQFEILSIGGAPPPPVLAGWKDTILLRPETDYRILIHFSDYTDPVYPYMYHCHLLWHEDNGMMGQFVVVKPGQRAGTPPDSHSQGTTTEGQTHDHH